MIPFNERATEMGLEEVREGFYKYQDQYSEVIYRNITTPSKIIEASGGSQGYNTTMDDHWTDSIEIPYYAIFTRSVEQLNYNYCGIVSKQYKFMGNDVLNQKARDSILEIGMPMVRENAIFNPIYTKMRNEIIIQSTVEVPVVGDVFPIMIMHNTYDGTGAAMISFGIGTYHNRDWVSFSFQLGQFRQIHLESSETSMSSSIGDYLQTFNENIADMIQTSFNTTVSEDDMLTTLDAIEELGKGRRKEISKILAEMTPTPIEGQPTPLPTVWQVFLAIVRYSSFEPNLNIKRLLENAAERVLVIPTRMYEVLDKIQG
jgi:hypothetical protein